MLLFRPIIWAIRRMGIPTFLTLALLSVAFGSLISGLTGVIRGFETFLAIPLIASGVLVGWGLARLVVPTWLAALLAFILGFETLIIRVGRLDQALIAVAQALFKLGWDSWLWPLQGPPNLLPAQSALLMLLEDSNTLLTRLGTWLWGLTTDEPAFDPVVTTLIWGLALWAIAVWAGWVVRRRVHPFLALLPAGGLLVTVLAHSRDWPSAVLPFLFATFLLMTLVTQHARERQWQMNGISFSVETRTDLAMVVIPLTVGLVMTAAFLSTISFRSLNNFIKNIIWEQPIAADSAIADSFGLPGGRTVTPLDPVRFGGLPRRHLLGSGPELSEQIVMVIHTDDPPPTTLDSSGIRYYWRSITYDEYNGRGWETSSTEQLEIAASTPIQTEVPPNHRILKQTVEGSDYFNGLLHTAGDVIAVDQNISLGQRNVNDIFGSTIETNKYQALSHLPTFTEDELRTAGTQYPDWIKERYLALPESVPTRVLGLARDLTATAPTPFDRAKAIEAYLREFPYTLDLPAPPSGRDIADYFLFDLQQGYCDYYATSMVTLARAAGIPARLAVGYINGSYDPFNHRYVVTEAEAHSWVEVYFPDIGWVNFEPTGGRPAILRETAADNRLTDLPFEDNIETPTAPFSAISSTDVVPRLPGWLTIIGGGLLVLLTGNFTWNKIDRWRLERMAPTTAITILQRRLYNHGHRLNGSHSSGDTPFEFADALINHIDNLAMRKRWGQLLLPAQQEVQWLTQLYVQTLYSPHHFNAIDQSHAIQVWQRLKRRLWLARLLGFSK